MQPDDLLIQHYRLTGGQRAALDKLKIKTVADLLRHFPSRYDQAGGITSTATILSGNEVTLVGMLEKMETKKSWQRKIPISEGYVRDASGRTKLRWFNQPYIAKMYQDGMLVRVSGKVTGAEGKEYIANPILERVSATESGLFAQKEEVVQIEDTSTSLSSQHSTEDGSLFAVYPESQGITSLWFRTAILKALNSGVHRNSPDPLPDDVRKKLHLPSLADAFFYIHTPRTPKEAEGARKRFAFEEIFLIQVLQQQERLRNAAEQGFVVEPPANLVADFMHAFPFAPTAAQKKATAALLADMHRGTPMARLLEGDVGSGKTAVAATAAAAVIATVPRGQHTGTLQVAYMAPTEILAKQHFESFIQYFEHAPVPIGLITGSGCYKFPSKVRHEKATKISRTQLLKWVDNGEIPILIGTHALIQKSVTFKHLALVVIDEQHRFGTAQRRALTHKETRIPHLLSMTATPIPRTLALTLYGSLDLTLLDQMPAGRKPVQTSVVATDGRAAMYEHIRTELEAGRQAYIICPRIDEPDPEKAFALQAKSVMAEAKRLQTKVFSHYRIATLHSKMKPEEKEKVMQAFAAHESDILVATSVVEVGVNVPNATLIVIEGAERFGLSQLHQLRGRVIRGTHQAYCYLVPESRGEKTTARLKALTTAKNGFELAEKDLEQRGPGSLTGSSQWGVTDIGMEALKNLKLVEIARDEAARVARELIKHPKNFPVLTQALAKRAATMHFE